MCQLRGSQLSQFVIHERQQLIFRRRIAGFNLMQDAGSVGHNTILQVHFRPRKRDGKS
jgi:hypothetical protein